MTLQRKRKLKPKYEGKSASDISAADKEEFALYERAKKEYDEEYAEVTRNINRYQQILQQITSAQAAAAEKIGKEKFSLEELEAMEADTPELQQHKALLVNIMSSAGDDIAAVEKEIQGALG